MHTTCTANIYYCQRDAVLGKSSFLIYFDFKMFNFLSKYTTGCCQQLRRRQFNTATVGMDNYVRLKNRIVVSPVSQKHFCSTHVPHKTGIPPNLKIHNLQSHSVLELSCKKESICCLCQVIMTSSNTL